ncbi:hypothetical protein [Hymenobacter rubripertinctus]|uniref:hypothetical protein n=1 Tax=Hymenobacter rubripertinctus TaxID=2029981 RepID=UPI0011C362DA|nr:hypothetical protein [Hymenobacter rubripertinctus]
MKKITTVTIFFYLSIFLSTCNHTISQSKINSNLICIVDEYINYANNNSFCNINDGEKILTIGVKNSQKYSIIKIMNSCPRISSFELVGYFEYKEFRIYIVGERNNELFQTKFPIDDIKNRIIEEKKSVLGTFGHPCKLSFMYKNGKFIACDI